MLQFLFVTFLLLFRFLLLHKNRWISSLLLDKFYEVRYFPTTLQVTKLLQVILINTCLNFCYLSTLCCPVESIGKAFSWHQGSILKLGKAFSWHQGSILKLANQNKPAKQKLEAKVSNQDKPTNPGNQKQPIRMSQIIKANWLAASHNSVAFMWLQHQPSLHYSKITICQLWNHLYGCLHHMLQDCLLCQPVSNRW